ncbi:hypothetical protein [Sporolactobacillus nakayamae]|uniref:Rubrerythrin n=1 Tax=Sporolactobacillus nakayamae TaxID=269670 RepID=A0A1I2N5P9_9BACL|nr:hypothetical protein [Sporolactobacillus nakayamae]SFF96731.1 hypothetical protein SAMN02982927_00181 [Sporolactobacillus nakayamae]
MTNGNEQKARILERMRTAINQERLVGACLSSLIDETKTLRGRQKIGELRNDSVSLEKDLLDLYETLSGNRLSIESDGTDMRPSTYLEGLRYCIESKLNAAEYNQRSADLTQISHMKSCFYRIALDELRHASWLQYYYSLYK